MKYWIGSLFVLLGLVLGVLTGMATDPRPSKVETPSVETQVTEIYRSPASGIFTVEHDGHRFVIAYINTQLTMVVHPDDGKAEKE